MRIRDQYDWIAIGDHPGALLSAGLAARSGLSVLVLPLPQLPSRHEKTFWAVESGACLDQESNYVLGLGLDPENPGLLLGCLERLGLTPQERSQIQADGAHLQVISPRARVHLGPRLNRLADELVREFGASVQARLGLAQALEKSGPAQLAYWRSAFEQFVRVTGGTGDSRRGPIFPVTLTALSSRMSKLLSGSPSIIQSWLSLEEEVSSWLSARDLGETIPSLEGVMTGVTLSQPPADSRLFEALSLMPLSRTGAAFRGGLLALRDLLRRLARRAGAELPSGVSCQRIFVRQDGFLGVLPSGHGTMVSASGGVLGCPLERARPLIVANGREGWLPKKSAHTPIGWKFSLALGVNSEAIQPGITRRMVWQEAGAPFLEIEIARSIEYGIGKGPEAVLFLRTCMPMNPESLTSGFQRLVAARMLRKATEILPFLEFHILRIFPEFRPEPSPELAMIYGFKSMEEIPAHLLLFQRPLGASRSWGSRSGIERLFLASQEAYPELGPLGWTIASMEAISWLVGELRRPGRSEAPLSPWP